MGARSPAGWVVLPAAVGLIAIVALASRSGLAVPAVDLPGGTSFLTLIEIVGYVALGVGVLALPVAIPMYRRLWKTRRERREDALPDLPWGMRLLGLAIFVVLLASQIFIASVLLGELQDIRDEAGQPGVPGGSPVAPGVPGIGQRDMTSLIVAGVILVVIAIVVVAVAIRWRTLDRPSGLETTERRRATHAALEVSLDALRREPDPRRAVIAAYAAMEGSMSNAGFGRHSSEAPLEYLRRVLDVSGLADEHLRTITLLFQHARFSDHPVQESMRSDAIDALGRVRAMIAERA